MPEGDPDYEITFRIRKTGEVKTVPAYEGDNLLRLAQRHDIPLEGACEGVTACSTCHVILTDAFFDELEDAGDHANDAEEDMLDQAFGLEPTSRLGCQLKVDARFDGQVVELPEATRNFYVDGHVPQPTSCRRTPLLLCFQSRPPSRHDRRGGCVPNARPAPAPPRRRPGRGSEATTARGEHFMLRPNGAPLFLSAATAYA